MRVENVKGAVWTVDELEFYKRRPQRSTTAAAAAVVFSSSATSPTAMNTSSSTTSIVDLMTNTNAFGFGYVPRHPLTIICFLLINKINYIKNSVFNFIINISQL